MGWLKTTVNYIKHKLSQKGPQSPKVKSDLSHVSNKVTCATCSLFFNKKIFVCRDILVGLQNFLFPFGVQILKFCFAYSANSLFWINTCNLSAFMLKFNPLTPISDQDRISPYNINTISTR